MRAAVSNVTDDDCVIFELLMAGLHGGDCAGKRALARHDEETMEEEDKMGEGEKKGE